MIPYLPMPSFQECVKFFYVDHLKDIAASSAAVLTVIHEQHPMTVQLERHPSVRMWREYPTYLANYGLALIDRAKGEGADWPDLDDLYRTLERQLDLATTEDFTPDVPPFMGRKHLHDSHLSYLITAAPHLYPAYIGKVPFGMTLVYS